MSKSSHQVQARKEHRRRAVAVTVDKNPSGPYVWVGSIESSPRRVDLNNATETRH